MKIALLFGSSGLIGGHLLKKLIENNEYTNIKLFVRSEIKMKHQKLEIAHIITFIALCVSFLISSRIAIAGPYGKSVCLKYTMDEEIYKLLHLRNDAIRKGIPVDVAERVMNWEVISG